ncbi:MAG: DEAD/DEAH box helicase [Weeksellaceae bacterium]|nr:DEAD/DEAH box helicase [Weeksellaceae bacterium]
MQNRKENKRDSNRKGRESKKFDKPRFSKGSGSENRRSRGKSGQRPPSGRVRNRRRKGEIDYKRFIHQAVPLIEVKYEAEKSYDEFPLHDALKKNLQRINFTHPTEIQEKSFEAINQLRDVLGIANTGTGKTGAFLIPLINALLQGDDAFSVLIMVPTRELAVQVEEEFKILSHGLNLYASSFIGGKSVERDVQKLRRPFHFIIGTPGRLVDLSKRNALDFENYSVLILDEYDRMLDMGFSDEVNYITGKMVNRDQTLLFSATVDDTQEKKINELLTDPVVVKVSSGTATAEHIDQDVVFTDAGSKFDVLLGLLQTDEYHKVLIFAETKRKVSSLTKQLSRSKIKVDEIHGDKSQNYRMHALNNFKKGKIDVLVATDVAARGLDISDVTHVINYETPNDFETYIHRIGRTGRAGKTGTALTFIEKSPSKDKLQKQ